MAVSKRAQITFEDRAKWIEDTELEGLLGERETLNEARLEAQKAYNDMDAKARERIEAYDLPVGDYRRCGEYIIENAMQESRTVEAFNTSGGPKVSIKKITAEQKVASGE